MKNWQKLFGIKPKFEDETPPDDTAQGDDKLQALANAVNELEGRVAKIENQLNDVQGDVDTIAEVVDTEEFAAIRDNAKDIVSVLTIWEINQPVHQAAKFQRKPGSLISCNSL